MTLRSSLLLSARYLFSPKAAREVGNRTARHLRGAVLGIGLSLIPLIVVLVVTDGMIEGIVSRYIELGTYHVELRPYGSFGSEDIGTLADSLSGIEGVRYAAPEIQGTGLAVSETGRGGVTVRAVDGKRFGSDPSVSAYLSFESGAWDLDDPDAVLLGAPLAEKLGVGVGSTVRIVTFGRLAGGTTLPRLGSFVVRGIFSSGYRELDATWAFVGLASGSRILVSGSAVPFVGIKVEKPYADLTALVSEVRKLAPTGSVAYTWYELNESLYRSYRTIKELLAFIMALIVLVAAMNVSSALIMLVLEKRRDIAVLKSVGASPAGITLVFLGCGLLTGVIGTAIGMLAGIFAAANINALIALIETIMGGAYKVVAALASPVAKLPEISVRLLDPAYYLQVIPVVLDPTELLAAASGTIAMSLLCSYIPARRAGRMKPLDILRKA